MSTFGEYHSRCFCRIIIRQRDGWIDGSPDRWINDGQKDPADP